MISSCTHISSSPLQNTGGIYGRIELNRIKKSFEKVKVQVEGTGLITKVDSSGIFYIPEVPIGEYTLVASAPEFLGGILESVSVARDSISIVSIDLKDTSHYTFSEKNTWKGIKIGKVDVKSKGKIKGQVHGPDRAIVLIENIFWVAYTDSVGKYELINILPGKYTLLSFQYREGLKGTVVGPGPKEGMLIVQPEPPIDLNKYMGGSYRPRTVKNVRVAPDSTSIVDIWL